MQTGFMALDRSRLRAEETNRFGSTAWRFVAAGSDASPRHGSSIQLPLENGATGERHLGASVLMPVSLAPSLSAKPSAAFRTSRSCSLGRSSSTGFLPLQVSSCSVASLAVVESSAATKAATSRVCSVPPPTVREWSGHSASRREGSPLRASPSTRALATAPRVRLLRSLPASPRVVMRPAQVGALHEDVVLLAPGSASQGDGVMRMTSGRAASEPRRTGARHVVYRTKLALPITPMSPPMVPTEVRVRSPDPTAGGIPNAAPAAETAGIHVSTSSTSAGESQSREVSGRTAASPRQTERVSVNGRNCDTKASGLLAL